MKSLHLKEFHSRVHFLNAFFNEFVYHNNYRGLSITLIAMKQTNGPIEKQNYNKIT